MKKQIGLTDTTLRDAHQSLWATRMKTADMLPILGKLDKVGYHSLEVWGGATFDVALRYLNEDPWERLRLINTYVQKTPLQMLLRGQNIVGYKHYPDDLVRSFIRLAAKNGIDIFRIFDALNDVRNMKTAIEATREVGAHAQATVVYTVSPLHTIEHYLETARELVQLGADSLCIKDMAGLLTPYRAYELVRRLKEELDIPLQIHCHYIGGMAVVSYIKAVEAGADVVDSACASLAFGSSQPPVETITAILQESEYNPGLDLGQLFEIESYFERLRHNNGYPRGVTRLTDMRTFDHQVPGGMISNLVSQLKEQKSLDRLDDVLEEIPRVRKELGFPPLVTPTSQVVGVQAVFNVLMGERYKVIPDEVKDYIRGLYGRPPGQIDEEVRKKAIGEEKIITCRPADLLEPQLDRLDAEVERYIEQEEDQLTYLLFPQVGLKFLKNRKEEQNLYNQTGEKGEEETISRREGKDSMQISEIRELVQLLNTTEISQLDLESDGTRLVIKKDQGEGEPENRSRVLSSRKEPDQAQQEQEKREETSPSTTGEELVEFPSPMVGTFYRAPAPDAEAFVQQGDRIEAGQTVCIIEAMKLMNEIEAEEEGVLEEILVENGTPVEYGQALFLIRPDGGE